MRLAGIHCISVVLCCGPRGAREINMRGAFSWKC